MHEHISRALIIAAENLDKTYYIYRRSTKLAKKVLSIQVNTADLRHCQYLMNIIVQDIQKIDQMLLLYTPHGNNNGSSSSAMNGTTSPVTNAAVTAAVIAAAGGGGNGGSNSSGSGQNHYHPHHISCGPLMNGGNAIHTNPTTTSTTTTGNVFDHTMILQYNHCKQLLEVALTQVFLYDLFYLLMYLFHY